MENEEIIARKEARRIAQEAKVASVGMAQATNEQRNAALEAMAQTLRRQTQKILDANKRDMESARAGGTAESLLDRLLLDEKRIESMAGALEDLKELPDPVGHVLSERTLYNGLKLSRVSVPLGVVAVVYEARPNVTADAAGICLKSGNAVVLRGGSLAAHSNAAIADLLAHAAADAGLPAGCIGSLASISRAGTDELMSLRGVIDVLVPRGGAGLISHCVDHAKVPVIETGTGNCHMYVHASADFDQANDLVVNAKCRRYGVCNACETLLVDEACAEVFLPQILALLTERGVIIHADECAGAIARAHDIDTCLATEKDWATEYLAPEIAVHVVAGVKEAIAHINRFGTHHSEAIVATDKTAIATFMAQVDAAAVYANASTAFTDGGQFGLGAEIGISTQKLHVRGPFALEGLTSYKYLIQGDGQVRA